MLSIIKQFFNTQLAFGSLAVNQDPEHAIRLAVAALFIEVTESDYRQSPEEKHALLKVVRDHFGLAVEEANRLISMAKAEQAESTDNFQFTTLINKNYNPEQKIRLIEGFWRIAFSDQELHMYEEHLIRRLADLLHVSHGDFIAAKHRIMNSS